MTGWVRRPLFSLSAALTGCLLLSVASAQVEPSALVREVVVRNVGAGHVDESFVLVHVSAKTGEKLNTPALSKDVKALMKTGRFSSVAIRAENLDDGLRVIYEVKNRMRLADSVVVEGADHFRESKLLGWLDLTVGDPVDDQVMGIRTQQILREYREDYFPNVSATWEIKESDREEGTARVLLKIMEGKRARVRRVEFLGNEKMETSSLRKTLKRRAWWDPRWLFRKKRYNEQDLEEARQAVLDLYLDKGFLDCQVDVPVVTQDKEGALGITLQVHEGVRYHFDKVALDGITLFPEVDLRAVVRTRKGDVAALGAIRRTASALRDYYGGRGYVNTIVKPVLDPDADSGEVDITFSIREGTLQRIRNIEIRGNTRTRDKVIRRELLVSPGDKYNEVQIRRSERIISNLGFFSSVRSYPQGTSVDDMKDLVIDLEEKRTGHFMVGAGFSSVDNLIGFMELSQSNFDILGWPHFTGGGQKLRLSGQMGGTRQDYRLSFIEPWFMDRRLSLGVDLYRTDYNYTSYDVERMGGALTVGKGLPGANRITAQYRLESIKYDDISDTNEYTVAETGEPFYFSEEDDVTKSSLKLTLIHNSTDNPLVPSRGTRASIFGKVAGGLLNYDTDIYGTGIRVKHYVPLWWGHVFSLRGRYEVVEEYGDTEDVPLADRLFLGGGRTLRGFEYRDVGPKATRQVTATDGQVTMRHRPVGGCSLALASAEYTIPIVSALRFASFYDTGNVWTDAYEFDPGDLASSWGLGLRLDIPGFPIRVDRGWIIEADDDLTDKDTWVVWIGYDY